MDEYTESVVMMVHDEFHPAVSTDGENYTLTLSIWEEGENGEN